MSSFPLIDMCRFIRKGKKETNVGQLVSFLPFSLSKIYSVMSLDLNKKCPKFSVALCKMNQSHTCILIQSAYIYIHFSPDNNGKRLYIYAHQIKILSLKAAVLAGLKQNNSLKFEN